MPHSIKLLQAHCQEKHKERQAAQASRRRAEELARFRSSQSRQQRKFRPGEGLSEVWVKQSPGFEELMKLNSMLKDRPPASFFASYD